jgi:D-amino peptidase
MSGGRALILGDIEGIVGVDDWRDIMSGTAGYAAACHNYAADVNATIAGLRQGGASEVLVVDTHAAGTNLSEGDIVDAELIGGPSVLGRIEAAIERDVDALAMVGFHAAAGTNDSFVPHSFNPQTRSWLNGLVAGEPPFYALLLGAAEVPTVLVSGDRRTIEQLLPFAPAVHGVETKAALSPFVARSFDPVATRAALTAAAAEAYRDRADVTPSVFPDPIELTIEARHDVGASLIATIPGMIPADGRRAIFSGPWPEVWRAFITANSLAALSATAGGSWYYGSIGGSLVDRLGTAAGDRAWTAQGPFYAEQFSPPWGVACPPEAMP